MKQTIKVAETTLHFSIWMIPQLLLTMVMIQNIYDSALYYANTERHMKYPNKTTTSIQQVVDQPEIYMVGQCHRQMRINYIIAKLELNVYGNFLLQILLMMTWKLKMY